MITAPPPLPDPRAARAPSIQVLWAYVRLLGRLCWIWVEGAPIPAVLALNAVEAGFRGAGGLLVWWVLAADGFGAFLLSAFAAKGSFRKNLGDTMAAMVWLDWRIARLTKPTLPRLVKVQVAQPYSVRRAWKRRREEGIWGLPAAACRIEYRPHSITEATKAHIEAIEWWLTNRYAFSAWETRETRRSRHILAIDMGELIIPEMVSAGDWE